MTDTPSANLLVIDDERSMREFLTILLGGAGYLVTEAADGESGRRLLEEREFDLILTDLKMGALSGMDVLRLAKARDPAVQVIVMTAFGTTETAVQAMKEGAADYITKPFKVNELKVQIEKALQVRRLLRENLHLKRQLAERQRLGELVGQSPAMEHLFDLILRLSRTRANVLITGESGTGKELVARAIHDRGADAKAPFVAINCGAIPPTLIESELFGHVRGSFTGAMQDRVGVFEAAGAGTLFLDEIGELPLDMQVKLLRVLQERKVVRVGSSQERELHCRVIAATNQDLAASVSRGAFREDLYYRLNVVQVTVPPLRERSDDIPLLVDNFLHKYGQLLGRPMRGVTTEAMQRLIRHRWVGSIRELENVIQRAIALAPSDLVDVDALPPALQTDSLIEAASDVVLPAGGVDLDAVIDKLEKNLLVQALERAHGVRKEAARVLGISFRSMRYRLDKHKIEGGDDQSE